jgi:hypothetical protein
VVDYALGMDPGSKMFVIAGAGGLIWALVSYAFHRHPKFYPKPFTGYPNGAHGVPDGGSGHGGCGPGGMSCS